VSEESRHAGWKPAEWAARIAAFAFPAKMSMLVESLMSALHYRWDPLTLQQIHKSGCFAIRDCLSLLGGGSQLRLARDFPSYWDKPSNSVQLSLQVLVFVLMVFISFVNLSKKTRNVRV
jgi:hypothetical protein